MNAIVEKEFEYEGFKCKVLFLASCYRCGYVGIPSTHELYGKEYDDIAVGCHGGLTYAESYLNGKYDGLWWIGFDCAHWGDGKDFDKGKELFKNNPEAMRMIIQMEQLENMLNRDVVEKPKSLDYCIRECQSIVRQIRG